jgi:hypothetical protein
MRRLTQSLMASVLYVACADAPTNTTEPTLPALATKAPPTSGPNVVRGPFSPGVLSGDAGLAVAVGFEEPFADHCADLESPDQPGSTQVVFTPPGGFHVKQSGHGLSVTVYEFEGVLTGNVCELVGAPVVATGTANFTLTVGGGTGAENAVVIIRGVVDLTSGGQARLLATTHVLIRPDGSFAFDHTRISLRSL